MNEMSCPTAEAACTDGRYAFVIAGVSETTADIARLMKRQGSQFVIMDRDTHRGHRLTLELNTGNRGIAVFLPGDPADPADLDEAVEECRRCWAAPVMLLRAA